MLFVIYKNILPPSIKEPLIRRTFFVGVDSPNKIFSKQHVTQIESTDTTHEKSFIYSFKYL